MTKTEKESPVQGNSETQKLLLLENFPFPGSSLLQGEKCAGRRIISFRLFFCPIFSPSFGYCFGPLHRQNTRRSAIRGKAQKFNSKGATLIIIRAPVCMPMGSLEIPRLWQASQLTRQEAVWGAGPARQVTIRRDGRLGAACAFSLAQNDSVHWSPQRSSWVGSF